MPVVASLKVLHRFENKGRRVRVNTPVQFLLLISFATVSSTIYVYA
jgi:hypothetical protein